MLNLSHSEEVEREITQRKFYSINVATARKSRRRAAYTMLAILLLITVFMFVPWRQTVRGTGVITAFRPQDRPQTLQTVIAGRIEKWQVKEGDYVQKGDTIVVISEIKEKYFDPEMLTRMKVQLDNKEEAIQSNLDKAQALRKQLQALEDAKRLKLSQMRNKIKQAELKVISDSNDYVAAQVQAQTAEIQAKRTEKLFEQGLDSKTKLEDRKLKAQEAQAKLISAQNKFLVSKNELINAKIELNSIQAEYQDKISKSESDLNATLAYVFEAEADLSKMQIEYANTEIRSSYYVIRAPQDGYIVNALKTGLGENIKEGEAIATIMPSRPEIAAEIYVRAMDLPLIQKGQKMRLQFDGWPAIVFSGWPTASVGTYGGIIQVVDYVNSKGGKYRILVTQDPEEHQWPTELRVGSGVYGWAILNTVPIWYELWRQLNGFPPDMVENLNKSEKK